MEPILTTFRTGPTELVRGVEAGAPTRDHGEHAAPFLLPAARHAAHPAAAGVDPSRLASLIAASGDPALLRVATTLAGRSALVVRGARLRVEEDDGPEGRRSARARLLVELPSLGRLEIRIHLDDAGAHALVLAEADDCRRLARASALDLARSLARATGLRSRADVAHEAPAPVDLDGGPAPEEFDSYA